MTSEEKQLLFKDLCARLPYGVVIHTDWKDVKLDHDHCGIGMLYYDRYSEEAKNAFGIDENDCSIIISGCYYGDIKPYLRPMSSMTEEEKEEFDEVLKSCNNKVFACPDKERRYNFFDAEQEDFMNAHHFDYRGLIEKGLALEATDGMYKQ